MGLARRLIIIAIIEIAFVVATRLTLHYLSWKSVEAESIRTALRILTAAAYWWLMKPVILSRKPDLRTLINPVFVIGLLLFLAIPVLVGRYELENRVAVMFAVTAIPVAVKEEFLFRGIMQNLLHGRLGVAKAILLTSLVFTVWHVGVWDPSLWVFSQIFLASVLLGLVYVRSGSILAAIVIHAVYDAIFSFTPLIPAPPHENWGFIPLVGSVALVTYWAVSGKSVNLRS